MSKGQKLGFAENFALSGAAAVISKTAAAPIERVKLLVQNQDEMIKQGRLDKPYKGVIDCTARTFKNEGKDVNSDSNISVINNDNKCANLNTVLFFYSTMSHTVVY